MSKILRWSRIPFL
uniref:Uncharacterized protein n=1 Tax=Anguilla anguilla TaxID=7936 RepID=A0A0E9UEG2_ANGAN